MIEQKTKPSGGPKSICNFCSEPIRANDSWKIWWDAAILAFAIFNSVTIPLTISFDGINELFRASQVYNFFNLTSNIFFIIDIFFQMNTTYYDAEGEEIDNKQKIRKHYLLTGFFIDFFSSFPVDYMMQGSLLRLVNVLKINRVFRLTGIINKMNVDEE
jgi:hypothetical protein